MIETVELKCPGCGERLAISMKECPSCHGPVVITTFNSLYDMAAPMVNKYASAYKNALSENPGDGMLNFSLGMCYLKLKLYDKALSAFEKAIEDNFDNSETYFYAAVSILKGKKAFLASRADINKLIEYVSAAVMIGERGIYRYFLAYVKRDYFARKFLNVSPDYKEELATAERLGYSETDTIRLFKTLGVDKPDDL